MGNLIDEKVLMGDLRNEDRAEAAFRCIFGIYYPRMRNFAMRFIFDSDDVEDMVQDVFSKLWQRRAGLSYISLSSLLLTMTHNGCLNFLCHCVFINEYNLQYKASQADGEKLYYLDMC